MSLDDIVMLNKVCTNLHCRFFLVLTNIFDAVLYLMRHALNNRYNLNANFSTSDKFNAIVSCFFASLMPPFLSDAKKERFIKLLKVFMFSLNSVNANFKCKIRLKLFYDINY